MFIKTLSISSRRLYCPLIKDNLNCNRCRWPPGVSVALSFSSEIKQRELKLLMVMHMNRLDSN